MPAMKMAGIAFEVCDFCNSVCLKSFKLVH